MAKTVSGIVTAKYEKNGRTKKGGYWKNVRLEIDGEQTYGGFVSKDNKAFLSKVEEGDEVSLKVEKDGDYYNYVKGKVTEKGADPDAGKRSRANSGNGGGAVREFAMSVGKATGIVQALISIKAFGTKPARPAILEAIAEYANAIHELVETGPSKDEEEETEEAEEEEEEEEEEDWDED